MCLSASGHSGCLLLPVRPSQNDQLTYTVRKCQETCVCVLESVSVNTGMHMYKACKCVCMSQRERLVWSQTQLTHYLSADKCHQLQLLKGLCCRMGERGRTGVLVLLEGRWSRNGGLGGDNTAMLKATSRPPLAIQVSAPRDPPVILSYTPFSPRLFPFRQQQREGG